MAEIFDPFIGTPVQTNRMRAVCKVEIDGVDITDKLEPHLLSLHLLIGGTPYQCELEIDDRDGRLPIPPIGARVEIALGWANEGTVSVFSGTIVDIQHTFGRNQGGRRMFVYASGMNSLSKLKEPMHDHIGEGAPPGQDTGDMHSLQDWLGQAAGNAGASVKLSPSLASIKRDYWSQSNESFMHMAQRMADEFGGIMSIKNGNEVEIAKLGEAIDGTALGGVNCVWGDNLIGWRVRPMIARSTWAAVNQHYYDEKNALWGMVQKGMGLASPWSDATAAFSLPAPAPNKSTADQQNEGQVQGASQFSGDGRIVINGEPRALPLHRAHVKGARPGVDGEYFIKIVEHIYARGTGFITWLDVTPNMGASDDNRVSFT